MGAKLEEKIKDEMKMAEDAERDIDALKILRTESLGCIEDVMDTALLTQEEIKRNVSQLTKEKAIDIKLEGGPFFTRYTKNGRHMLIYSNEGFLSAFDTKLLKLHFEISLKEQVKDAVFLQNECFLAVAQQECVFVYNNQGVELHSIRENRNVFSLEYLPYHFLLCSLSSNNFLKYIDISTGKMVSEIYLKQRYNTMKQNSDTAIMYLGSDKGTVSLWSPNSKEFLMKVLCHNTKVTNVEVEKRGKYMVTTGVDKTVKVWDIRNNYKPLNTISPPYNPRCTGLSDTGCLSIGSRKEIFVYKDLFVAPSIYLKHRMGSQPVDLQFCPYEDMVTVGHTNGITNLIVPGSGDPIFDTYEDNPFETKKERQNSEVRKLMEKVPYEFIGTQAFGFQERKEVYTQALSVKKPRTALDRFYRN